MSYANRKRTSGPREPNGRPQRSTVEQLKEMDKERAVVEMKFVMNQPHRKGTINPTDQRHESAFGRFCVRRKLRLEITTAADQFASLVRGWRAAKGVPVELRVSGTGNGEGPSDASVRAWGERIAKIEHAVLAQSSNEGYLALRTMILDDYECNPVYMRPAQEAAVRLAVEMGTLTAKDSPFC